LEQWDELRHLVPNKYTATQKRLALQHLALHHQTNADRQQRDGRSMEYTTVLEQLGKVLPGLNLKPEQDIQPMLDEIVQRSGLLLRIDGGQRYQFAHLTLQEYFAAAQLTARVRELIELFREERDAWRETVKLWCGLSTDSTELIQAVYNVDQLTAFECLADAQKVDPCLATEILESFKARLGEADAGDRVARAFGAVAAASTPRGIVAFDFLKGALTRPDAPAQQTTAAHALSFTNLPRAATMLAAHRADGPEVGAALIRMGDLAVPALKVLADAGDISALSDLQAIGTPRAAEVLFPLLWHEAPSLARQTAWCLAVLLSKPEIEEALRNYTLTEEQRRAPQLGWVWEPFMEREPVNSALPVIAGRIAYLIDHALLNSNLAPQPADPRLIIPLCAVKRQPIEIHFKDKTSPELVEVVSRVLQLDEKKRGEIQADICWLAPGDTFGDTLDAMATLAKTNEFPDVASLRETFIKATSFSDADSQWQRLMNCLPLDIKFDLLYRLLKGPQPTQSDWRNLFRPIQYSFARSWHFLLVVGATLPISLVGLVQIYVTIAHSETFFTWANAGLVAAVLMDAWFWLMTLALMEADSFLMLLTGPIGALYSHSFLPSTGLFGALYPRSFLNIAEITMDLTIALVLCLPSTTVLYFATRYGLNFLSESQIVLTSLIPSFAAMPYGLPATAANVLPEIRSMAS
jgi:hypothetical protein